MNQLIKTLFFVFVASLCGCQLDDWQKPIDQVIIPPIAPCNGHSVNCGQRLNDVIFPTTLKSYCYEIGVTNFVGPSQKFPVHHQLNDGIRAIMLDVYYEGGQLLVINKGLPLNLGGSEPLIDVLNEIKDFMSSHLREVVVVMLNTTATGVQLQTELETALLLDSLHSQEFGAAWPTLGELIESGNRLVIFSNSPDAGSGFSWNHSSNQYIEKTSLPDSRNDFNCAAMITDPANKFYLLQHRVTSGFLATPNADSAKAVNAFNILFPRIGECQQASGKLPNFIAVDYYTEGDLFQVCNQFVPIID